MEERSLGRTGARVSALGFGGAPAGLSGYLGAYQASAADSRAGVASAVRRALERGVTYFDTAPGYGDGLSEELLGGALGPDRERIYLATKTARADWAPAAIQPALEASLRRLRTDRVDLLQLHGGWWGDEEAALVLEGGLLDAYERLRAAGLVRHLGFTAEGPTGAVERLIASGRFDVMMIGYNLLHQAAGAYRNRALPPQTILSRARAQGMGVVTMRTLTSGLFGRWLARVAPAAAAVDWHGPLLGYVLSHPQIDVALVGMRTTEEVEHNAAAVADPALRLDLATLNDAYADA